jgi:hypothetical protein
MNMKKIISGVVITMVLLGCTHDKVPPTNASQETKV